MDLSFIAGTTATTTEEVNTATVTTDTTTEAGEQPPTPPMFGDPDREQDPSKNAWNNVNHFSECDPAFEELVEKYRWLENTLNWLKEGFPSRFEEYHKNLETLSENSTFNASALESHRKCSEVEEKAMDLHQLFTEIMELAVNITKSETLSEAYTYAVQIPPLYKGSLAYTEEDSEKVDEDVREICAWLREYGREVAKIREKVGRDYGKVKDQKATALRHFESLITLFNKLYKEVVHKINPTINMAKQYTEGDGSVTKMALSGEFETPFFTKAIEDLSDINKDIVEVVKDYTEEMTVGLNKMKNIYQNLFTLKLPVINTYNVHQLPLVKGATELSDTLMQNLVNSLETNLEENINSLVTETYQRVTKPIADLRITVVDPVDDILRQIAALDEALRSYKESTKMNTVFFM